MESLKKLKKIQAPIFRAADARLVGVSKRMLSYLAARGDIVRRAHGIYSFPEVESPVGLIEILRETLAIVPNAIIGLETALQLYNLSDEATREIYLIVSQSKSPSRKLSDVRFFRARTPLVQFDTRIIDGLKITTIEQTMVDLLRSGRTISELVKIFQDAQRQSLAVDISRLKILGELFHVKGKVSRVIEAVF